MRDREREREVEGVCDVQMTFKREERKIRNIVNIYREVNNIT